MTDNAPRVVEGQEDTPRAGVRRYQSPTLIEYGAIAKLTQGSLSTKGDAMAAGFRSPGMG